MPPAQTVLLPSMGLYSQVIAWTLQGFGLKAKVIEPAGPRAVELALQHLRGAECLPCLVTLGDLLAELERNPDMTGLTYFMPTSKGPCRFGLYKDLQELTLKELGRSDLDFLSLDANEGYAFAAAQAKGIELALFKAIVAADILEAIRAHLAPAFQGQDSQRLNLAYEQAKGEIQKGLRNRPQGLGSALKKARAFLAPLKKNRMSMPDPPVIGLVGEIFMRGNPSANGGIVARLESLGLEVAPTPMAEWLEWVLLTHAQRTAKKGRKLEALKVYAKLWFLELTARRLKAKFPEFKACLQTPKTAVIAKKAAPYAKECFGGEGLLMLGKAKSLLECGVAGIVCLYPFGCLPGNIVRVLSKRLAASFKRPWLNVSIEPSEGTHTMTRLEAFAGQIFERAQAQGMGYSHSLS